jgi:RimJ/RimL family protein N-acetyltransferase
MSGHPWPIFDLRIRTPRLELRLPTDDDLIGLLDVVKAGITEPERTVFMVPWHQLPSPALERQFLQHGWKARGSWDPANWAITFVLLEDGRPVGQQEVGGRNFAIRKVVQSGSWLGREFQGRGLGTEARAAILALAFEGLGAIAAESGYFAGNTRSQRVSEKLGYETLCEEILAIEGRQMREVRVRCTRETWRKDLVPVTIEGLDACLPLFGVGELPSTDWATF